MAERELKTAKSDREEKVEELKKLFQETQALPQIKTISDGMIAAEIEKMRNQ